MIDQGSAYSIQFRGTWSRISLSFDCPLCCRYTSGLFFLMTLGYLMLDSDCGVRWFHFY